MKFLKSFFFTIILFYSFNTAKAQTEAKKYDAAKYFAYTNKAELQIVDSQYTNAISYYDSAFSNLAVPLSQDMYNYSVCAVLEKKYETAYDAIKFLIERGCDSTFFFRNPVFHAFRDWGQIRIRKNYPAFIANRSKYIDSVIIRDILEMNKADQSFFRRLPNNQSNPKFLDSLQRNDDSLTTRLKKYFSTFQYLHEEVIGVRVEDSKLTCYPIFDILLRHHYQNLKYELTPVLKNALDVGYLRPELYASWVAFELQRIPGFGQEGIIYETKDSLYISKYQGIRAKIEENRKKIGLCTLEEQVKKTIFSRYMDKNGFLFSTIVVLLSENNKSYIESLRNFTNVIPKPNKK